MDRHQLKEYYYDNTYMHENHSGHEADSLAIASFLVGHGISMEYLSQSGLAPVLEGAGKVWVGGECPSCSAGRANTLRYYT